MPEITLDELDTRLAVTAAALLKTVLQAARLRNPEATDFIDSLTAATLTVKAAGPQIQLELLAPAEGGMVLLYGGTFEECGVLQ
ncbi:MAG: hypothetical protein A2V78_02485 [Betaproteobacteria bacterium RBG_16_64_18]|nr:MAG: hypothetical protein A2V78_02485 [Betaproteobacteria bacterium RBG_16_64_18]